jgi:hypothetical protein
VVLTGWAYRKAVQVNTSSAYNHGLSYYAIKLKLYYGSGSDNASTGEIYLNQHCRTDFGDVRFALPDDTLLPYWFEEKVDGNYVVVWVRIPVSSSTTQIYIYYGNANATYVGDPTQVFVFFDDFTTYRSNPNLWSYLVTESFGGKNVLSAIAGNTTTELALPTTLSNLGVEFRYYIVSIGSAGPRAIITLTEAGSNREYQLVNEIGSTTNNHYHMGYWNGSTYTKLTYNGNSYSIGVWYRNHFYRSSTTGRLEGQLGASTVMAVTHTTLTSFGKVKFGTWDTGNKYYIDWVAVKYYSDPEPSVSSIGSEEVLAIVYSFSDSSDLSLADSYGVGVQFSFADTSGVSLADVYSLTAKLKYDFIDSSSLSLSDSYTLSAKLKYDFIDTSGLSLSDSYSLSTKLKYDFADNSSLSLVDTVAVSLGLSFMDSSDLSLSDSYSISIYASYSFSDVSDLSLIDSILVSTGLVFIDESSISLSDKYELSTTAPPTPPSPAPSYEWLILVLVIIITMFMFRRKK